MLQGHNGAETPSGEQIKLRIGGGWRDVVGKGVGEDIKISKKKRKRKRWTQPPKACPHIVDN